MLLTETLEWFIGRPRISGPNKKRRLKPKIWRYTIPSTSIQHRSRSLHFGEEQNLRFCSLDLFLILLVLPNTSGFYMTKTNLLWFHLTPRRSPMPSLVHSDQIIIYLSDYYLCWGGSWIIWKSCVGAETHLKRAGKWPWRSGARKLWSRWLLLNLDTCWLERGDITAWFSSITT